MTYPTAPSQSPGAELPEVESPQQWAELTERVELPQQKQAFAGLSETQTLTLERVGCPAEVNIKVTFEWETPAAEEVTLAPGMPWRALKKCAIKANGVSGIISCGGTVLESRQKVVFRSPEHAMLESTSSTGKVAAKTAVKWVWVVQVPIAEDLRELEGIVLAQSEETALGIDLTWASEKEIAETGKIEKVKGSVAWHVTLFTIGTASNGKQRSIVLPDLSTLHGLTERSTAIPAEGEQEAPLTRTSGDLLRYFVTAWKKANATQYDPLTWTAFFLQYGGNQKPLFWSDPSILVERNARDYLKRPDVAGVHYLVVDTTLDDAMRDAIRPMLLSELKAVLGIPSAPETGAMINTAQETLYPAAA